MEFTDSSDNDEDRVRDARERSTRELFSISALQVGPVEYRQFRVEGHTRLSAPLYHPAFAALAAACLLCGWFNRRGQGGRLVVAITLMVLMQALALGANNLATRNLAWVPLMYALPLAASVGAFWMLTAPALSLGGRRKARSSLAAE
jgi:lipopolysaccharide export system permease protein